MKLGSSDNHYTTAPQMSWKSKGLSNEIIKPPATKNNSLNPKVDYLNIPKFRVKFEESCLKTIAKFYTPDEIINFFYCL